VVPRERWTTSMVPVADWLALTEREAAERIPYVLAVDAASGLHRVIVDSRLMQATRRCVLLWHRLQEHGGIHNSHAEQALAREKAAWEVQKRQEMDALKQAAAAASPAAAAPAEAAAAPVVAAPAAPADAAAEAAPPSSDEPWIETIRCSSCNECQNINDKLFGYNDNKQAYFKDLSAGTYRQIVEAAEACQVAIIHPGKPKNPNEPGLEELLERAKPFM
jgi:ferredoxin